jgi:hypothetical protein
MLTDLPRWFGSPAQIYVENKKVFDNLINAFNGKRPIFVSTFKFPTRNVPIVDCAVFDIDSKLSLRIPYNDTKKLKDFCESKDIPYVIQFSGGKGFHFFLITKPEEGSEKVKDKLYSIQLSLVQSLKIHAIDLPTVGRLRWLIRLPSCKYIRINKDKNNGISIVNNGLYCRYLPPKDFDKGLNHILKLAETPGIIPKRPKATYSMDEIIEKIPEFKMKHKFNNNDALEIMQSSGSVMVPTTCAIGLPCLKEIASQKHPTHFDRVELVAWLKMMGYRDIAINGYLKSLKWTDYNYRDTATNVASIKPRFPKCSYLRGRYDDLCNGCSLRR